MERMKANSKLQIEKLSKLEIEFSSRNRDDHKFDEERRKLDDLLRLEKEKFMNSEIDKRKYQMEYEISQKDKEMEINRLNRQLDHEKAVAELNLKNQIKKYE